MALIPRADSLLLLVDVQDGFYGPAREDVDRDAFGHVVDVCAWVVAERLAAAAEVLPKPVFAAGDWTRTLADSRGTLAAHPELARPPGFLL